MQPEDACKPSLDVYVPATHMAQVLDDDAPSTVEYKPDPQRVQSEDASKPVPEEYDPAMHLLQVPDQAN